MIMELEKLNYFLNGTETHNNRIHADKIELRRFALQLCFAGDAETVSSLALPHFTDWFMVGRCPGRYDLSLGVRFIM